MARLLPIGEGSSLATAWDELRGGRLVAFPTDTVYGIGTLPRPDLTPLIYAAKRRPPDKPIPLLLSSTAYLGRYATNAPPIAEELGQRCWPGALTMVLPGDERLSRALGARDGTIAFRVPNHAKLLELIEMAGGALAVTSANISGAADSLTAEDVREQLGPVVALILDGGRCAGGVPSTVVRLAQDPPRIVRNGPLDDVVEGVLARHLSAGAGSGEGG